MRCGLIRQDGGKLRWRQQAFRFLRAMPETPADAMGVRARWDQLGWQNKRLWVIGGDGEPQGAGQNLHDAQGAQECLGCPDNVRARQPLPQRGRRPSAVLETTREERLENWRMLQELAGLK